LIGSGKNHETDVGSNKIVSQVATKVKFGEDEDYDNGYEMVAGIADQSQMLVFDPEKGLPRFMKFTNKDDKCSKHVNGKMDSCQQVDIPPDPQWVIIHFHDHIQIWPVGMFAAQIGVVFEIIRLNEIEDHVQSPQYHGDEVQPVVAGVSPGIEAGFD
jgi:hypothetical protein